MWKTKLKNKIKMNLHLIAELKVFIDMSFFSLFNNIILKFKYTFLGTIVSKSNNEIGIIPIKADQILLDNCF